MKMYLASLAVGLLVGTIYGLLHIRSPAPPVIALIGLLGILAGEQLPSLVRHALTRQGAASTWFDRQVKPHVFGRLPQGEGSRRISPASVEHS
ncbi:MAG: XapX domain-containing protein [Steroidobacteraceae bacterium]